MPSSREAALTLILTCAVAGCGSSTTPLAQEQSAISQLASILHTYNTASVTNLPQQSAVCKTAAANLSGLHVLPGSELPSRRAETAALAKGYAMARAGFQACSKAAATIDYPAMAQAQLDLGEATSWIERAKADERRRSP